MDQETDELLRRQEELRQQQAAAQYQQDYSPIEKPQQDAQRHEDERHGTLQDDLILQAEQRQQELDSLLQEESARAYAIDQHLRAERERKEFFQQQEAADFNRANTIYWQNFYKRLNRETEEALRFQAESRQQEFDGLLRDDLVRQEERRPSDNVDGKRDDADPHTDEMVGRTISVSEARERFKGLRDEYAKRLGVGQGGQVHHAIELQVLKHYPGAFTEAELNASENMRGIPAERE